MHADWPTLLVEQTQDLSLTVHFLVVIRPKKAVDHDISHTVSRFSNDNGMLS